MQPSDSPDLKVRRVRKLEVCKLCANTGLVVSEMAFKRCTCPAGSLAAERSWDGVKIHPEDAA